MSLDKKPLVSIIVPVYNAEEYLEESLDCLVNQTLENIEIICINDASSDELSLSATTRSRRQSCAR